MILVDIYRQYGCLGLYLAMVVSGALLFFSLAGVSYLVVFRWLRARFVPDYQPNREELGKSVYYALYSLLGNGLLMLPIEIGILTGRSKVYFNVAEYGWGYMALSAVAILIVTETLIYWIHRALHNRFLYRTLHLKHHQFRVPTPLAGVAFHPLDSFAQALPHHLCAYLFPVHVWLYHGFVTAITLWAVLIHDRISWVPYGFVNNTGCHTAHHWFNKYNYGQFFTFWDKLCGTYKDPRALPAQFFASMPGRHLP